MIRAIVIADSGTALSTFTRALGDIERVEVVRHASGRTRVGPLVHGCAPDLVLIDEMHWPPRALARIAEVRRAAPEASIVVVAKRLEGAWLADALRTGAAAVLPASADPDTFRQVVNEVLGRVPAVA